MSELDLKSAPRVQETVLKRKAAKFASALNKSKQSGRKRKREEAEVKRAENFVLEFRNRERFGKKAKRKLSRKRGAAGQKQEAVPNGAELLFVVRIRAGKKAEIPAVYRKVLKRLRLSKVFTGSFVRADTEVVRQLRAIEDFITWGHLSPKLVGELVHKRGFTKVDGVRVALKDNTMVEDQLGDCGVICTDDVVHEIASCGDNFERVNKFLCPFHLDAPKRGFTRSRKLKPFGKGGEFGDRAEAINALVRDMN